MRLVRSFPDVAPSRNHIRDDAHRLVNHDYDYSGLADLDDDVLHLDWDIAIGKEELQHFARTARADPERVLAAPYRIYPDTRRGLQTPVWALQKFVGERGPTIRRRQVEEGEPTCHLFGFGMVYLPRAVIAGFCEAHFEQLADGSRVMDDMSFSGWHHYNVEPEVPITWDVRPVHLNYWISKVEL